MVRAGGERLAVHRDAEGVLHAVSARCTHLGCLRRRASDRDAAPWGISADNR
ncbi:Rieske 2Fe-2S domain-containing protein [Streptomyces collinus]|uniref:Rieske 2Fe-2S domain-containing protein n=1 Tax=Streptomyces collinus TaxID=42684 RepID=UPI003641F852